MYRERTYRAELTTSSSLTKTYQLSLSQNPALCNLGMSDRSMLPLAVAYPPRIAAEPAKAVRRLKRVLEADLTMRV